jgi:hypothetical protein
VPFGTPHAAHVPERELDRWLQGVVEVLADLPAPGEFFS